MPDKRSAVLQDFLELTTAAIAARVACDSRADMAMRKVATALAVPMPRREPPASKALPACRHLEPAIAAARRGAADLARLADAIGALAPHMAWRHRPNEDSVFMQGHANGDIVGAEAHALECRPDVRIGISLMAPGITYPDHRHPPEEVYIVLSAGDWRQSSGPWQTPGLGGIVYNSPDIVHAMRSGPEPLLAVWCLPVSLEHRA